VAVSPTRPARDDGRCPNRRRRGHNRPRQKRRTRSCSRRFEFGPSGTFADDRTDLCAVSTVDGGPGGHDDADIDHQLATAESPSSIAQVEALVVPTARDSKAYPLIPLASRHDPNAYARAFTSQLLDRTYRTQSRSALLEWAQGEEAANTLPGVPASAGGKVLYASLADPTIGGGTAATPVPPTAIWAADSKAGVTQRVIGIEVAVDPSWSRIVGEGWQPRDPLMTMMDVRARLAVSTRRHTVVQVVSMVIGLGSCARQPGLGAVAVQDWARR
jgi:hypothetical protein